MKLGVAGIALVATMIVGCAGEAATEQAQSAPVAAVEAPAPATIDQEVRKRIGLLSISSQLNADLSIQRVKAAMQGVPMKDGVRYEYTNLLEDSDKSKSDVLEQYVAIIKDVQVESLKAALKEGMAAEITFYGTVSNVVRAGDGAWLSEIQNAREVVRQADSKIEAEKMLAMTN